MLQNFENFPPNWNAIGGECQHTPLTCPWTITWKDGTLVFIITSLEWTFNYDFWIRVTAHPEKNPNNFIQLNIDTHHPLFESIRGSKRLREIPWTPLGLPPTSYSWGTIRLLVLRRHNLQNGQCSSSLCRLGTGRTFWHRPKPECRSIHPPNRVQD